MAGTDQAAQAAGAAREVLHQRGTMPKSPVKMVGVGVLIAGGLFYMTLLSKKKPEASAIDVAKVSTGLAGPENTHPRK